MKRSYQIAMAIAAISMSTMSYADTAPAVSISGKSTFAGYGVKQDRTDGKNRGVHASVESSEINFKVGKKSDDGSMRYGAVFTLLAHPNIQTGPNPETWKRAYGELETKFGAVRIGNADSVTLDLVPNAGTIMVGMAGFSGAKIYNVFNSASEVNHGTDLYMETFRATKVVVNTPELAFDPAGKHKVTLGVDFTPNTEHRGNSKMVDDRSTSFASQGSIYGEHVVGYAAAYKGDCAGWDVTLGAGGLWGRTRDGRNTTHLGNFRSGKASSHNLRDISSYKLGGTVVKDDYSLGWGYVYNGRSGIQKHGMSLDRNNALFEQFADGRAGHLCNLAVARKVGPADFSVGFQYNTNRTNKTQHTSCRVLSLDSGYKIMDGMQVVLGVNLIKHDTNNAAMLLNEYAGGRNVNVAEYPNLVTNDNKGFVVASGFKIRF